MNTLFDLKDIVAKDIAKSILEGNDFYSKSKKTNTLDKDSTERLNKYLIKELKKVNNKEEFIKILNRYKNIFDDYLIFKNICNDFYNKALEIYIGKFRTNETYQIFHKICPNISKYDYLIAIIYNEIIREDDTDKMFELIEKFGNIFCNNLNQEIIFDYFYKIGMKSGLYSIEKFEEFIKLCPNVSKNDYYNIVFLICLKRLDYIGIECLDKIDLMIKENNIKKNEFFKNQELLINFTKRVNILKKRFNKDLSNLDKFLQS